MERRRANASNIRSVGNDQIDGTSLRRECARDGCALSEQAADARAGHAVDHEQAHRAQDDQDHTERGVRVLDIRDPMEPRPFDEPALKKTYEMTHPVDEGTPGALVQALSQAIEKIAAQVAADAGAL